jgi:protein-histidine N-methyltransferase
MAKATAISKKILEKKVELLSPKHSFLSIFLLLERKNESSLWKIYLDILPSDYNNFPIFFTEEDFAWLEGSPFLSNYKKEINKKYKK